MDKPQKLLMIIAGEASGDMRAAEVVNALKSSNPALRFTGVGGTHMNNSGVELFADITELAVIGFVEVIKHYGRLKKVFDQILKEVDRTKPDAVLLIDYPGFNLRLARKLKDRHIKVIYFISPQVWAWKEKRVKTIKQVVDKMLVLFSFEHAFYKKHGMDVEYVGHPLVDAAKPTRLKEETFSDLGMDAQKQTIGLLPGSREKEIDRHLPVMLKAASLLYNANTNRQFVLLKASTISSQIIEKHTRQARFPMTIANDQPYNVLNICNACVVASGTATLETAILKKPMVIIYKTSWLTYALARFFVKIPNIGLVNIIAGKTIVPELIQNKATALQIARQMEKLLSDSKEIHRIQKELSKIYTWLGVPGASRRAAKIILKELAL